MTNGGKMIIHTVENDESRVLIDMDVRTLALMFAAIGLTDESDTQRALRNNGFTTEEANNADSKGSDQYCMNDKEPYKLLRRYYDKHPV